MHTLYGTCINDTFLSIVIVSYNRSYFKTFYSNGCTNNNGVIIIDLLAYNNYVYICISSNSSIRPWYNLTMWTIAQVNSKICTEFGRIWKWSMIIKLTAIRQVQFELKYARLLDAIQVKCLNAAWWSGGLRYYNVGCCHSLLFITVVEFF